jgi:hypothetical protein
LLKSVSLLGVFHGLYGVKIFVYIFGRHRILIYYGLDSALG